MDYTQAPIADFDATHAVGLLISNKYFNNIGMDELENVEENHATMKRNFAYLGITEVIEVSDSYDDMVKAFKDINRRCIDADLSGGQTKLLVYVFAASHGIMYNGATMT